MADHVPLVEVDEGDPLHGAHDTLRFDEARDPAGREIDLGDVARDHGAGAEADSREEHLHLLRRRVLRLVEDDERVVEAPPPHEREGRDLDHAALQQPVGLVLHLEIEDRVVERSQVGLDLLRHVPGEEAQPLARLDRRPREDDPLDFLLAESGERHRHREIGLSRARGPDPEDDVVVPNRLHVARLVRAAWRNRLLGGGADLRREDLPAPSAVQLGGAGGVGHVVLGELVPATHEASELAEEIRDDVDLLRLSADRDLPASRRDVHAEAALQIAEVIVAGAEEAAQGPFGNLDLPQARAA